MRLLPPPLFLFLLGLFFYTGIFSGQALTLKGNELLESLPVKVVLFPFREAVLSTQIEGIILKQNYRMGERFKKDDILVKLDDSKYKNELLKTESAVREAELHVKYTDQKAKDNQRLFADGLQSDIELKRSLLEAEVAKEKLRIALVAKSDAMRNLYFCTVKAPFDGTVEALLARDFETVKSSQPILGIIDDTQLLAVMNLPTSQLSGTKRGQLFTVKINETGKEVTGSVFEIAGKADHRSETFEVKILLNNKDHLMKAGMSGILLKIGK